MSILAGHTFKRKMIGNRWVRPDVRYYPRRVGLPITRKRPEPWLRTRRVSLDMMLAAVERFDGKRFAQELYRASNHGTPLANLIAKETLVNRLAGLSPAEIEDLVPAGVCLP